MDALTALAGIPVGIETVVGGAILALLSYFGSRATRALEDVVKQIERNERRSVENRLAHERAENEIPSLTTPDRDPTQTGEIEDGPAEAKP